MDATSGQDSTKQRAATPPITPSTQAQSVGLLHRRLTEFADLVPPRVCAAPGSGAGGNGQINVSDMAGVFMPSALLIVLGVLVAAIRGSLTKKQRRRAAKV